MKPHLCDDRCTCPDHSTPFWYSRAADKHACQNPDCQYANGVKAWGETDE